LGPYVIGYSFQTKRGFYRQDHWTKIRRIIISMPTESVEVGEEKGRRQMAENKNKYTTAFVIPVGELNNKWDNCRPYHTKEVLP
jgi:hypothetical protein